jgi:hypothetical protein
MALLPASKLRCVLCQPGVLIVLDQKNSLRKMPETSRAEVERVQNNALLPGEGTEFGRFYAAWGAGSGLAGLSPLPPLSPVSTSAGGAVTASLLTAIVLFRPSRSSKARAPRSLQHMSRRLVSPCIEQLCSCSATPPPCLRAEAQICQLTQTAMLPLNISVT